MSDRLYVKTGDSEQLLAYPVTINGAAFDFSDSKWKVLASARDQADLATLYDRRDITAYQATAPADPAGGVVGLPLFTGQGLVGASTGDVAVGAGDVVTVTLAGVGGSGVVRQELYMSKAAASTGPFFLIGSGPDGWLSGGVAVGDPAFTPGAGEVAVWLTSPGDDTVLTQAPPTLDESITNGQTAAVATPAAPGTVVSSPGTGVLTTGNHRFQALNRRDEDTVSARTIEIEIVFVDTTTGKERTIPAATFRLLEVVSGIG